MNTVLAAELEAIIDSRVPITREASALYLFATSVRGSATLPPSSTLQTLYEETTLSIAGHKEFTVYMAKYKEAEQTESKFTPKQKAEAVIEWLEETISKEASLFSESVSKFPHKEDERSRLPELNVEALASKINGTPIPYADKSHLMAVVRQLEKEAEKYYEDMSAVRSVWMHHGFGGLEGKELKREEKEFQNTIARLESCNLSPDF